MLVTLVNQNYKVRRDLRNHLILCLHSTSERTETQGRVNGLTGPYTLLCAELDLIATYLLIILLTCHIEVGRHQVQLLILLHIF